jgi:hypothetical protein
MITISRSKYREVEKYCEENVGVRKFCLHNAIGGEKWTLLTTGSVFRLEVTDPHVELLIALKFGQ